MLTGEGNPFAHFFPPPADFCRQVLHSGPIATQRQRDDAD